MLTEIFGWVYGIWAIAFMVYAVIWNVGWLCYKGKCKNIKRCRRRDCCFGIICDKQVEVLTEEELQLLHDVIAELKNRNSSDTPLLRHSK